MIKIFSTACTKCSVDLIAAKRVRAADPTKEFDYAAVCLMTKDGHLSADNIFLVTKDTLTDKGTRVSGAYGDNRVNSRIHYK